MEFDDRLFLTFSLVQQRRKSVAGPCYRVRTSFAFRIRHGHDTLDGKNLTHGRVEATAHCEGHSFKTISGKEMMVQLTMLKSGNT